MVRAGRDQAGNVGFSVQRTGTAGHPSPGPAAYRPQWQALRPATAAAAVGRVYAAAGRHYEAIRATDAVRPAPGTRAAEECTDASPPAGGPLHMSSAEMMPHTT